MVQCGKETSSPIETNLVNVFFVSEWCLLGVIKSKQMPGSFLTWTRRITNRKQYGKEAKFQEICNIN